MPWTANSPSGQRARQAYARELAGTASGRQEQLVVRPVPEAREDGTPLLPRRPLLQVRRRRPEGGQMKIVKNKYKEEVWDEDRWEVHRMESDRVPGQGGGGADRRVPEAGGGRKRRVRSS